jgi:hypothetical protein
MAPSSAGSGTSAALHTFGTDSPAYFHDHTLEQRLLVLLDDDDDDHDHDWLLI